MKGLVWTTTQMTRCYTGSQTVSQPPDPHPQQLLIPHLAHLKTPGEALVFVLFYVTHSKCYVLTERFTPSQASPEYAEVLSYMR